MKQSQRQSYIHIFVLLMKRDLMIFMRSYPDYLANVFLWIVLDVGVFAYLMPYFGLQQNFGTFILASVIASLSIFESMHSAESFVVDLNGEKQITYDLTLPVPSFLVLIQRACLYMTQMMLLCFFVLPFGKILFWHKIDLSHFSFLYFSLVFVITNIVYGFLALWLISFLKDLDNMRNVWIRLIMPLWVLGGYQFSWQAINSISPWLGYLVLLNPVIYITEAFRVAILGQPGYLNFWLCMGMMCLFGIFFGWRGIYLLKKRLDCV